MTFELDVPSLAWIDEISRLKPKPSPLEIALWLDSLVMRGKLIDPGCRPLDWAELCLRCWPAFARA